MHKEIVGTLGRAEKIVFDKEDIAFIENNGAMLNKKQLAEHFGISVDVIYDAMKRQPEMMRAYGLSKMNKKIVKKEPHILVELTPEQLDMVEEKAAYLTTEQIADLLGIGRSTFYNIRQRQPEVGKRYEMGKARKIVSFAEQLEKKGFGEVDKGDTTALIFFLKTRARWSEAVPETKIEDQIVLTPEEQEEKNKDVKLFTEFKKWKKEKGIE